jgi:hypothetical protein
MEWVTTARPLGLDSGRLPLADWGPGDGYWTDDPPDLAPGPPGGPRLNVTPIFRASKRGGDGSERGERARYPRSGFCLACVRLHATGLGLSSPDNRTARAAHPLDNICPGDAATSCTPTNRFGRQWIAIKPATIARVAKVRRPLLVDAIAQVTIGISHTDRNGCPFVAICASMAWPWRRRRSSVLH